jgi:hypothetical protein
MPDRIVITGVGVVTPLGHDARAVWRRIQAGESAGAVPTGFDAAPFACKLCAPIRHFEPQRFISETKLIRLMNRDAQLAVAAAQLALADARLVVGRDYPPEEVGLFGATGTAGMPLAEVAPLLRASTGESGRFDLGQFGRVGLRSISPILSFKILSNMPVCFVSLCHHIQGANAVYTPWEGQGAQAIAAGIRAMNEGDARCALVGGCDVKTHELAFLGLEKEGLFRSWKAEGAGVVPGEGAAFLVLETEQNAAARGARAYARVAGYAFGTCWNETHRAETWAGLLGGLCERARTRAADSTAGQASQPAPRDDAWETGKMPVLRDRAPSHEPTSPTRPDRPSPVLRVLAASDGGAALRQAEQAALMFAGVSAAPIMHPKRQAGNLFAAAAALQVGLGAVAVEDLAPGGRVLANCFGPGSEQAAFLLEKP